MPLACLTPAFGTGNQRFTPTELHALVGTYAYVSFCLSAKASTYRYVPPLEISNSDFVASV
jgi:hypothetical protein